MYSFLIYNNYKLICSIAKEIIMGSKHIAELLIEANKKISNITAQLEKEDSSIKDRQGWIDDLNTIIRQLDHAVEELEKN
jgi:hypothetical protein